MATRLNARLGLSVGTTPTNVIDANGSITANSVTVANTLAVGANVNANTTGLYVGNSTVNSTVTSSLLQVANSTSTTNVSANGVYVGGSYINSTAVVSNNTIIASAGLDGQVAITDGTTGALEIGKIGRTVAGTPYIDFHSSASSPDFDTRIIASGGNSTPGSGNLQIQANTLNLPNTVITGSANASVAFNVGSNVQLTTSQLSIGNTQTNTVITSSSIATQGTLASGNATVTGFINVSSTANVGGAITARGDVTVNGQLTVANAASLGNTTVTGFINVSSSANVGGVINARSDVSVNGQLTVANTASLGNTTINGWANVTGNVTANNMRTFGSVQIDGDLVVNGNTVTVAVTNLNLADNMIYLNEAQAVTVTNVVGNGTAVVYTANNDYLVGFDVRITGVDPVAYNLTGQTITAANSTTFTISNAATGAYVSGGTAYAKAAANPDLGFAGGYNDGTYRHAGFFRDATDGVFKVFDQYGPEPSGAFIDTSNTTFRIADFQANNTTLSGNTYLGGVSGSEGLRVATQAGANRPIEIKGGVAGSLGARIGVSSEALDYYTSGGYSHFFATNGPRSAVQFAVTPTSLAVNYLQVTGGVTGANVALFAAGADANVSVNYISKGTGAHNFKTASGTQFQIYDNGGTVVNFWSARGTTTGNAPVLYAQGTDADVSAIITSKGTGIIGFYTNGYNDPQFRIAHTASAVNYLQATGAIADGTVALTAQGASANVSVNISAKGTAQLYLGAGSTGGAVRISTYGAEQVTIGGSASAVNRLTLKGGATGVNPQFAVQGGDTNIGLDYSTYGTGAHSFYTNDLNGGTGQLQFRVSHVANTVNYINISGNATLNAPIIQAAGTDSNVDLIIRAKGTWSTYVGSTQGTAAAFNSAASGANYFQLRGTATGTGPSFSSIGGDTNIDMNYVTKGTGSHIFNSGTGTEFKVYTFGGTTVNYWSAVGSTTTTAPFLYAQGSDVNVDGKIATKGAGQLRLYTNGGNDEQVRITHTANAVNLISMTGANTGNVPTLSATGNDSSVALKITTKAAGNIDLAPRGITALLVSPSAAPVNYFQIKSADTTASPSFAVIGGDANINLTYITKGTGSHVFQTGSTAATQLQILDTPSAVNYLTATGSTTTQYPILQAAGSDVNVGLIFKTKGNPAGPGVQFVDGAGQINFGIRTSVASAVNYLQVQANPTGNDPVLAGAGSDVDVGVTIIGKGAGTIKLNSNTVVNGGQLSVGANVIANTTALFVGNSTVNTIITSSTIATRDLTLAGNLTVSGTTTYINTTNLNIGDNIITLNADVTGATAPSENAGIEVNRGSAANSYLLWNESAGNWVANSGGFVVANTTANTLYVAANGNVGIGNSAPTHKLSVNGTAYVGSSLNVATTFASGNATITGFANVSGDLVVNGNVTFGGTASSFLIKNGTGVGGVDEGGEILLGLPANTSLNAISNTVSVDIYQNKLRVFETGSPNRGVYIDLSTAASGVGTNLLAIGGFTNGQSISVANLVVTGALTANGQTGTAGQALMSNGTATYWGAVTVGAAAGQGSNTAIQFNDSGTTAGATQLAYDKTTNSFIVGNSTVNSVFTATTTTLGANSTATAFFVAANGNVGIGSVTPTAKLQIAGTANISGNVATAGYIIPVTNSGIYGNVYITATADVTGNSNIRIQTQSGWVDIGSKNTSFAHFTTDRARFYFDHPIDAVTGFRTYNGNNYLYDSGLLVSNGNITVGNSTVNAAIATTGIGSFVNVAIGTATPDAALKVAGTANVSGVVTLGSDLIATGGNTSLGNTTITGNLTVTGTTTYVNTTTLNIGDNIITLNADVVGTPTEDAGIEINRGTSSNSSLYWNETNKRWVATNGNDSNAMFAVVSNSYMRTAYVTLASVVDQWGTLAQPGSFAEFVIASGVNKLDNKNRDYFIANGSVNTAVFAANGNVGIGHLTPGDKLAIAGNTTLTSGHLRLNTGGIFLDDANNTGEVLIQKAAGNTTQAHRISISNLGGPNGVTAGAYWNGLQLAAPTGIANSTAGASYPRMSMFYSYSSNTAPTDLAFNMWAGNDAGMGTAVKLYSSTPAGTAGGIDIAANGNVGIGNTAPASKLVIQGASADANVAAGVAVDVQGAVIRVGDGSGTAQTFANGVGFKIADNGNAHYSIGQIGGKLVISDSTSDVNALYPATRTDIITANSTNVTIGAPVIFNGYLTLPGGGGAINAINLTTSTTTANQVLHTTGAANWRVVKYLIQVTSGSSYQATEITLLHDGTNVYKTEYGQMYTGAVLATFDADINTGNIRLLVTPVNAVTTIKATLTTVSV